MTALKEVGTLEGVPVVCARDLSPEEVNQVHGSAKELLNKVSLGTAVDDDSENIIPADAAAESMAVWEDSADEKKCLRVTLHLEWQGKTYETTSD